MPYAPQDFSSLLGMPGFSNQLLENHFKLYQGYVTNTNKLTEMLAALATDGKGATPEYAELKRRFGWEFNGMRLHELYFGNMSASAAAVDAGSALAKKITEDFGSHDAWMADFKATSAMRGIGWTILYLDRQANRLFNVWINEHDVGHLAGGIPLLILDVFEHAYMIDYGLNRADYIGAFFKVADWAEVAKRFDEAQ
jgi:Fe-Mn family superoxide dismutase